MAELMLAKSYKGAKILKQFEKGGKPYATIQIQCDRCTKGIYAIGVENGHIKPHPAFGGVCLKCGGAGYLIKDVRLYTEKELEAMDRANERARLKKIEEQEKKMKAEFQTKSAEWLEKNGFSPEGKTYIYARNDSYSIRSELKQAGFRFDSLLLWHKATKDEQYADRLVEVKFDDVFEWSAWGQGHYKQGAKEFISNLIAATQPKSTSTWIGEVGDKITNIKVQLVKKYTIDGKYGLTTLYGFQDENGNIINWWSSTFQEVELNDWVVITRATIKKLDTYEGTKQTVITRAKLGQISG